MQQTVNKKLIMGLLGYNELNLRTLGLKCDPPVSRAAICMLLNGNAEIFITGDKELLNLHKVKNMEIVSPRMFWEKLKAQHNLSNSD